MGTLDREGNITRNTYTEVSGTFVKIVGAEIIKKGLTHRYRNVNTFWL